jgi:hypothetical protein
MDGREATHSETGMDGPWSDGTPPLELRHARLQRPRPLFQCLHPLLGDDHVSTSQDILC